MHLEANPVESGGPLISHLFLADDLLLFGKASVDQLAVILSFLDSSCDSLGQKVSVEKSRMLVSKNVHHSRATELSNLSGFHLTSDLGKYLGVLLLHAKCNM